MANTPRKRAAEAIEHGVDVEVSPELAAEIAAGLAEFDRGEFIELTHEQLDHAASTGELPWHDDESPA